MLFFSQRRKIAMLFEDWRKKGENGVIAANCPENVLAFLSNNGLLNEEKVQEYLKTHQPNLKDRK